jgi:5-methylcytosine-specific restriction endonuclease McrA
MQLVPEPVEVPAQRPKLTPLASERYAIQFTADQETHDLLGYAQALLGHELPSGDLGQVFKRALEALVRELEKRKFAAADRPRRRRRRSSSNPRHVPAEVKRAVWKRDQGQCTFRSDSGRRCPARTRLDFDHIEPVARGGTATVQGMRLRCRAHNQYDAECVFGAGFIERKREQARAATAEAREAATAAKRKQAAAEVVPYLRTLGFRADESRAAAELCEPIPEASLEQRVKLALSYFANRHCTRWKPPTAEAAPA